ncbi:P-loop containing nucleoside triphosphate hydrolase [Pseudocohnilembus persalinus]|uniref:p-loop containing nucleoside triphosphate hydrolase n=1 Tax=Pseudocohnilembus persalinus TaxID=266149 RepID=A0A0V0QZZ9_PSEPJ|nr:P-loop containing nucleoside triphosphate hydrolase [Pseudocohnilembus persalinus]|eukprot:KRX07868.1 P-loop containing nucleoside triphosphate hydrolase [Pseudocohnilembus persalinus]
MKLDVIIIGNSGAGKTSLVQQYKQINPLKEDKDEDANKEFSFKYKPTLGIDLVKKDIVISNKEIKLCIWDTAGQEKYAAITSQYFQKADGVAIVFDLTDLDSFKRVKEFWIEQVNEKSNEDIKKILIGNKVDLKDRKVKFQEAQDLADILQIKYFETSAKTQEQVVEAFDHLAKITLYSIESDNVSNIPLVDNIQITENTPKPNNKLSKVKDFFKSCF